MKKNWNIPFQIIFDNYLNNDNYLDVSNSFIKRISYSLIKNNIFNINLLSNFCNKYAEKEMATPKDRTKAILSIIDKKSFKFLAILLADYGFEVELI